MSDNEEGKSNLRHASFGPPSAQCQQSLHTEKRSESFQDETMPDDLR
jgi:hypothetical protein